MEEEMKKWQGIVVLLVFFLAGCGSILVRPAVDDVKKVAIVSVYMNKDFYNIKSPRSQEGTNAFNKLLGGVVKKGMGELGEKLSEDMEQDQIVTYGLKMYADQLKDVGGWQIVALNEVVNNEAYQKLIESNVKGSLPKALVSVLQEERKNYWVTPDKMHYIPISSVVKTGKTYYYGDAKDPQAETRKALGQLCQDLRVDGIALVELDMGYRFGKIGKLTWSSGLGGATSAIPSVSSALVVINKNGEVAVNTGLIARGGGERYEGDSAPMVKNDKVVLKNDSNRIVEVFNQAIEKSAIGLKEKLAKAFSK